MNGTYICWQTGTPGAEWAILLIDADGGRQVVSQFPRYADAIKQLRQLRAVTAERHS